MQDQDLANLYRPKFFKDFNESNIITRGSVEVVKELIKENEHFKLPSLLFSGSSGCGKSTLALLYAKATLCLNREPGEFEPCGYCEVCTGEDTSNIYHHTITNSTESREPIKQLINRAEQHPLQLTDRKDQNRQFIIIDEIQLASPELLAMLLHPLEHSPSTTTWILVTMDLDKLQTREPIIKEAIESRTTHLPLGRLSEESMAKTLLFHYPDLEFETALAISKLAEGNMRKVWNSFAAFQVLYKDVGAITADRVWETKLGSVDAYSREKMWKALADENAAEVKKIFEYWNNSDTKVIAKALEEDIIKSLDGPNEKAQLLLSDLSRWAISSHNFSLLAILLTHLGTNIEASSKKIKANSLREIKSKTESKSKLDQSLAKVPNHLLTRIVTIKAQSAKHSIPKFFFCETFEEVEVIYSE